MQHNHPQGASLRDILAERAAALRLAGCSAAVLRPALRHCCTAELLRPQHATPRCIDVGAELDALCAAALCAVRRRPGWLYALPACDGCYAAVRARLLQAAVLSFMGSALQAGAPAVVLCEAAPQAALLHLRCAASPCAETLLLLRRLAQECGGLALFTAHNSFSAVLRLPAGTGGARPATAPETLLRDRYSPLYLYLAGFCADADE